MLNACCCQICTPPQCVSKHPSQDLVDGRQQQLVGWVCVVRSLPPNKYSSFHFKGWLIIQDHKGSEQITKLKKAKQDYQVFLPIEVRTNLALAVEICTNRQARKRAQNQAQFTQIKWGSVELATSLFMSNSFQSISFRYLCFDFISKLSFVMSWSCSVHVLVFFFLCPTHVLVISCPVLFKFPWPSIHFIS